ncbi:MAG TPA: hypothetical protein PLV68_02225, partial [Ilumatobacteraceae bacterium]|nr:hypothetical protein [Ilumatobacteraceae bacterium]
IGDYRVGDLDGVGSNFQTALTIAAALLAIGAVSMFQPRLGRWGAGMAMGAGIALVPFVGYAVRFTFWMSDRARDQAEIVAAAGSGTYVERTLTPGFWLLVAAAVAVVLLIVVALAVLQGDEREPLPTAVSVLGAIACVAAVAGQLIPVAGQRFGDVWSPRFGGRLLVVPRLGMFAVVALVAVIGFLLASRFGLGLAIGASSLYVWQWVSSQFDLGVSPQTPAMYPPGVAHPHLVTTIGAVGIIAAALTASIIATHRDTQSR